MRRIVGAIYNQNTQSVVISSILWGNFTVRGSEIDVISGSVSVHTAIFRVDGRAMAILMSIRFCRQSGFSTVWFSHCLGAGIDSIEIGGIWYVAPATDYGGNLRPAQLDQCPIWVHGNRRLILLVGIPQPGFENNPKHFHWNKITLTCSILQRKFVMFWPYLSNIKLTVYNLLGKKL